MRLAFARAEELPHLHRIETAIDRWLETGRWMKLTPEEKYHTNLRFGAALLFLAQAVISDGGDDSTTIFPFPKMGRAEVARWMLVHWWHDHGHKSLCALGDPHQPLDE